MQKGVPQSERGVVWHRNHIRRRLRRQSVRLAHMLRQTAMSLPEARKVPILRPVRVSFLQKLSGFIRKMLGAFARKTFA